MRKASWWLCGTAAGMAACPAHTGREAPQGGSRVSEYFECLIVTCLPKFSKQQLYRQLVLTPAFKSGFHFWENNSNNVLFIIFHFQGFYKRNEPWFKQKGNRGERGKGGESNAILYQVSEEKVLSPAEQLTPREICPGWGWHLKAPKLLAFPNWPLTPHQRCGHSAGAEPPPSCRPCEPRCAAQGGGLSPSCRFPAAAKPPGHGLAAKPLPKVWNHPATHNGHCQRLPQTFHGLGRGRGEISALRTELAQIQPSATRCKLKAPCNDLETGINCW